VKALVDFALGLEPISVVVTVAAAALQPEFVRSLRNLFLASSVFIRAKGSRGGFVVSARVMAASKAVKSNPSF
jgi:hypothetical protein